jgi:hypothetical protein
MFIQVIEGTTSDPEAVHRQLEVWERDLRPGAIGYLGSAGGCTADGSCIVVARFTDRTAAVRNSERPEQSRWWADTEDCFDGPVSFHETDEVHEMRHGRLEDAHFIQVMEGHVVDRSRVEEVERESEALLGTARPDLLGSIAAYFDDGEFTDVSYFSSEAEARAAERRPMSPEMAAAFDQWQQVLQVEKYLDITQPWLTAPA